MLRKSDDTLKIISQGIQARRSMTKPDFRYLHSGIKKKKNQQLIEAKCISNSKT
jgi:hypothetical protein